MEKIIFNSYDELASHMFDIANDDGTAYAILFFDDAVQLIKSLLSDDRTTIGGVDIASEEYKGYTKEYFVSLDNEYIVDVQPAWSDECKEPGYLWFDAEKVYVIGDANSSVIKCIDKAKCVEIEFDTDECDTLLDALIDSSELIFDDDGELIGVKMNLSDLFKMILGE